MKGTLLRGFSKWSLPVGLVKGKPPVARLTEATDEGEGTTSNKRTIGSARSAWQRKMVGSCFAVLMATGAFGQNQEKVNATARVHPIPTAPKKSYAPASAYASPGLQCKLYPAGSLPSAGLEVSTDDDGYARFYAVRAAAGDTVRQLTMDCTDSVRNFSTYTVDLTSDDTFAPRPIDLSHEHGIDRPSLKGDPLSYTQAELIRAGYGLRPDPKKDALAYARWLKAASVSGRLLEAQRPTPPSSHTVYTTTGGPWTGSVLTGAPNYLSTYATFNVPSAIPSGDETTATEMAIWNGLGGFGTGSGLIQGGVGVRTTPNIATYYTWREYCCGDGDSNGYGGNFTPRPGDEIYSVQWYCDASGNVSLNGGYGCSYLEDETTGAVFSCTLANGSPCWSVKATPGMTLGRAAEFVIEFQSNQLSPATTQFTDFTPQVNMDGAAYSSATGSYSQTVSSDPVVYLLTDFTHSTSHMSVSLGTTDETYFSVSQWARVGGAALSWRVPCPGPEAGEDCLPQSIAVGPNANGSTIGDPWVLGQGHTASGDYYIYHWQNSQWVQQPGAGTQIAVSPQGYPWVINHLGQIFYWNGSAFELAPGNGCAISIGVGPATSAEPYGDPWAIGCNGNDTQANANGGIYRLQGSTWVQQPGAATQIAVSPQGVPWVINAAGSIYHWYAFGFVQVPGCATSIGVGPTTAPLASPYGDAWVTGCGEVTNQGYNIYQFQNGTSWVQIPGVASQISVSPDLGVPWVVNFSGQIFE